MNKNYKLISILKACVFIIIGVVIFCNAKAEYYLVYGSPQIVTECGACYRYRPTCAHHHYHYRHHYISHPRHHKHHIHHHYLHRTSSYTIEEQNQFDLDRRTADDVGADMDIDN